MTRNVRGGQRVDALDINEDVLRRGRQEELCVPSSVPILIIVAAGLGVGLASTRSASRLEPPNDLIVEVESLLAPRPSAVKVVHMIRNYVVAQATHLRHSCDGDAQSISHEDSKQLWGGMAVLLTGASDREEGAFPRA